MAGGIAGAATTPLDVVKTRVMLEARVGGLRGGLFSSSERGLGTPADTVLRRACQDLMVSHLPVNRPRPFCHSGHVSQRSSGTKGRKRFSAAGSQGPLPSRWAAPCSWASTTSQSTLAKTIHPFMRNRATILDRSIIPHCIGACHHASFRRSSEFPDRSMPLRKGLNSCDGFA